MKLKDFDGLEKRDFDNRAVLDGIRQVFKERDKLQSDSKTMIDCTWLDDICMDCEEACPNSKVGK